MRLAFMTWPEVEAHLARDRGILVPIGSTEQHGPTGLIGTDALCAEAIATAAGELADALVGPTLTVGMARHHMAFPGTVSLAPETLVAVICDVVASLAHHGFAHVLFVNGHGGNGPSLAAAFQRIADDPALAGRVVCDGVNWWQPAPVARLQDALFGAANGVHATASEISVTWHLHPDRALPRVLAPRVAPSGRFGDAADLRRRYPDGRIGSDPALASPAHGARLLETAAAAIAELYRTFCATGRPSWPDQVR